MSNKAVARGPSINLKRKRKNRSLFIFPRLKLSFKIIHLLQVPVNKYLDLCLAILLKKCKYVVSNSATKVGAAIAVRLEMC